MTKQSGRRFQFVQLDVFTSRPLEGNPLAVFTNARGLTDPEMQALAKEMNLSETTFILPDDAATEARDGVRVRIFTVEEELEFAGHPTLGTAAVIRDLKTAAAGSPPNEVALALRVGKIPVTFSTDGDGRLFGEMRQRDPQFGTIHAREEVARATGIALDALDASLPIQTVSTGLPFTIVPLRSGVALRNLKFNHALAAPYMERARTGFLYFVTRDVSDLSGDAAGARLHARMIFYGGEDPATGSAGGCCTAWAVRHDVAKPEEPFMIAQGLEMRRPSFLHVRATRNGDDVTNVRVGGNTVEVLRGEVTL